MCPHCYPPLVTIGPKEEALIRMAGNHVLARDIEALMFVIVARRELKNGSVKLPKMRVFQPAALASHVANVVRSER